MAKKLMGQAAVSATATPQRVEMPDIGVAYTLQNTGTTNAVYYKFEPLTATSAFAGTDAVLRGLGAGKLDAGESLVINPGIPWLDVVCATGLTSTLNIEPGMSVSSSENLKTIAGGGLTFTPVPISQAAGTQELLAKTASETQRLHSLSITCSAAALVEIEDKDGGVLASWNFGANGGIDMDRGSDANRAIQQTVVNKGLQIVVSAGTVRGQAIVSTGV